MTACRFPHLHPRRATRGFTLIELLVAITVLAIVAVLGWRGLDSIVRTRVALNDQLDQTRGLQLAFAQMQRDCAQIATTDVIPDRAPLVVEPGRLVLVRMVFTENQPTGLQVVSYQIRNGILTRRESATTRDLNALDALWTTVTSDNSGVPSVTLQTGLATMTMRVWINDGAGWRTPGIDVVQTAVTTSSGNNNTTSTAPTGLEVSLQPIGHAVMTKIFLLGAV
ncbi:MAG: prepilin-type N-terminal cleavage/methylation domain-containing protein [Proteobacteria bacterium]|nr:prepilin-type N-terminal cleavage/methylation domain-containing protein [Pseudomonadota bacterium]